jgi:hypothetical protein
MNPYGIVGSGIGVAEAASLRTRLMAWHDATVAHERRLRSGQAADMCDDECPHVEARALWEEVSAILGPRASELTFLRSRALAGAGAPNLRTVSAESAALGAEAERHARARRSAAARKRSESFSDSADSSQMATAEL